MRLTVVHGRNGAIAGIVAYPKDAPPAFPQTQPGQYVTEMDAPADLKPGLDQRLMQQRLNEMLHGYVIDVTGPRPSLARKP